MSQAHPDLRAAIESLRAHDDAPSIGMTELARLLPYLSGQWKRGAVVVAMIILVPLLFMPVPYLIKYVIDTVVVEGDASLLTLIAAAIIALQALGSGISFLLNYSLTLLNQEVLLSIKGTIFERLLKLPFSFYDKTQTGYLMARVREVDSLSGFFSLALVQFLTSIFEFLFALAAMLLLEWRLTLMALAVIPFLYLVAQRYSNGIRVTSRDLLERSADLSKDLQEALSGISVVKTFGAEKRESAKFKRSLGRVLRSGMNQSVISSASGELLHLILAIGSAIVLWASGLLIIQGNMTVGLYVAFAAYFTRLTGPVVRFTTTGLSIQPAMVTVQRALDLLDIGTEEEDPTRRTKIDRISGPIVFDHVSFSYDGQTDVLHDITFRVEPRERVALVGPSGSGKSTIVRLLMGLYSPSRGTILIDGHDIATLVLADLRSRFAVVSQNVFLFNDSVKANIQYSNPGATEDMVIEASKMADAHDFILGLPHGYDTIVGERGMRLSGGQIQRIALARALLRRADVIILDEATSHLDFLSESRIQGALERLIGDKICITISHRPSALSYCSRVLCVEGGTLTSESKTVDVSSRE